VTELLRTSIPGLSSPKIGKVRDVYDLGDEVLIVATDRISAFDVVMENGIPDKGAILTQMSRFWFELLKPLVPNHFITTDLSLIESRLGSRQPNLALRSTLAKKAKPLSVECVARGYLTGSLYKEYRLNGGSLHGLDLPNDLEDGSKLETPIFSPATKAESGHDANISFGEVESRVGKQNATQIRNWTIELFNLASRRAKNAGIILADTKFEFGETENGLVLIDEVLTPDSSRFWEASDWGPGKVQPSFDKQFVRNYLETLNWNKQPPGPKLPEDVVNGTRARYLEAFERLTGFPFHELGSQ